MNTPTPPPRQSILDLARATGDPKLTTKADKIATQLYALKHAVKLFTDLKHAQAETDRLKDEYQKTIRAI